MRAARPQLAALLLWSLCLAPPAAADGPPPLPPTPAPEPTPEPVLEPAPADAPAARPDWADLEREDAGRGQDRARGTGEEEEALGDDYERHLGLGVSILKEHGFGAVARMQFAWFGLEASVALSPYFLFVSGACSELILEATWRVSASALGTFGRGRLRHGPRLGFTFDGFFGPGGQLGYQLEVAFNPWLALSFGAGLLVFPLGEEPAEKRAAAACGVNPSSIQLDPLQTIVQPYIGASLLFYVF